MKKIFNLFYFSYKFIFDVGAEKSILPAITFTNSNHESFEENKRKGFTLGFYFWKWCFTISFIF